MLYLLAGLLAILSGLTCYFSAIIFGVSDSAAWLVASLGFGLIASSLPMFGKKRSLKDAMISIALFATYMAGMASVWQKQGHHHQSRHFFQIKY